jgi:signal transduction histidine kinase
MGDGSSGNKLAQGVFPDADQQATLMRALDAAQYRIGELAAALDGLREANRAKDTLIAMMSHELRTPLNAIIGFSDAALEEIRGPLPAAYRAYFADIHAAGTHLSGLIEALLDLAKLGMGQARLELRPVSLRELVAGAHSLVAPQAAQGGVDLTGVALGEDYLVAVDALRARQILVNLLANAIKFSSPGSRVGMETRPIASGFVDVTVWDTGIGIAEHEQPRVFDAFYQGAEAKGGPANSGAGLGLAIARDLAERMGGRITLNSKPGQGSRFTLRLPLAAGS